MDEQHIPQSVHRLARRWMPTLAAEQAITDRDLWPAIQRRLEATPRAANRTMPLAPGFDPPTMPTTISVLGEQQTTLRKPRIKTRRLMTAVSALAAIGLLTLTTLTLALALLGRTGGEQGAAGSAPTAPPWACPADDAETLAVCLFHDDDRWLRLERQGLVQHPTAAGTVNGITLTVWRAYADANVLALALTVVGQPGQPTPNIADSTLTDDTGRRYGTLNAARSGFSACPAAPCAAPLSATVMVLDASALPTGTTEATFHLTVGAMTLGDQTTEDPAAAPGASRRIEGPWALSLSLPVLPARVAEVGQEVSAGGTTLRLERVIATPAETRLLVEGVSTRSGPVPFLTLAPAQGGGVATPAIRVVSPGLSGLSIHTDDAGLTTYRSPVAAYDRPGDWFAEFKFLPTTPGVATPAASDAWVFQFTVPDTTR